MAPITWQFGCASLIDPTTVILAVVALVALLRFRVNSVWLIVGGALAGLIRASLF